MHYCRCLLLCFFIKEVRFIPVTHFNIICNLHQVTYLLWRASRVHISIALETHEEHLLTSHHGLIGHTCGSPAHKQHAHGQRVRNLSMRQQANFLTIPFQTAAGNRSAPPRAPHGFTRTWTRLRAPLQARAPSPLTCVNKIHPLGT